MITVAITSVVGRNTIHRLQPCGGAINKYTYSGNIGGE